MDMVSKVPYISFFQPVAPAACSRLVTNASNTSWRVIPGTVPGADALGMGWYLPAQTMAWLWNFGDTS